MSWRGWLLAGVLLAGACAARADIAPPPPKGGEKPRPPARSGTLEIYPTRGNTARIELPQSLFQNGKRADSGFPVSTLMTGLFLSLAMVGGGLWAVKRRGPGGLAAVVSGALVLGVTGGVAWANMAPPVRRSVNVPVFVEVTNRSNIRLELTADQLASLQDLSVFRAGSPQPAGAKPPH